MKTSIKTNQNNAITYPCVRKWKPNDEVILFLSSNSGICLSPGSSNSDLGEARIGLFSPHHINWVPCSITLNSLED